MGAATRIRVYLLVEPDSLGIVSLESLRRISCQLRDNALIAKDRAGNRRSASLQQGCRPASNELNPWLAATLLVVLAVVAHVPALPGDFVWDDVNVIRDNLQMRTTAGLMQFWTSVAQPDYWPVAFTSHWIEWHIWGDWAPGYRMLNVILHGLNGVLLWRLLLRLEVAGAWLVAAVFVVHPVTVEAVAWILQRKTLLSTTLVFGSLLCYLRWEDDARSKMYWAAVGLFVAALLTKTAVIMWPFVLLLVAWWRRRTWTLRDLRGSAVFFVIAGVTGVGNLALQRYWQDEVIRDDGFISRLATAGQAVVFYIAEAIYPVGLSFIYPRWKLDDPSLLDFVPYVVFIAILIVAWRHRAAWGAACLVAMGYYLLNLFPVLGFVNIYYMVYSLVADHWQYLALPGLLALLLGWASHYIASLTSRWRQLGPIAATLLVGTLTVLTWQHAWTFGGDEERLWRQTLDRSPNAWLAHNGLGVVLLNRGDHEEATARFRRCVEINPDYAEAENNWGATLYMQAHVSEAIEHFQRAVDLDAGYSQAHLNLGVALWREEDAHGAAKHLGQAMRLDPSMTSSIVPILEEIEATSGVRPPLNGSGQPPSSGSP